MSKEDNKFRKKNYTDFDARLDQELEEEILERQKQIRRQAPDLELLRRKIQEGTGEAGLVETLKKACSYFLCYDMEADVCRTQELFREAIRSYGDLRLDLMEQAGLLGCLAFKQNMPTAGEACAKTVADGLQYFGKDAAEELERGYGYLRNLADISLRTRNEAAFEHIVVQVRWLAERNPGQVPSGLTALLQDLLFVASDRRQTGALKEICRMSRGVLRELPASFRGRRKFALEWSATAAQIAQRGWEPEARLLLASLCRFVASVREPGLVKALLQDFALHMQMQSHWDGAESAFRLYYPCQQLLLILLRREERRYVKAVRAIGDFAGRGEPDIGTETEGINLPESVGPAAGATTGNGGGAYDGSLKARTAKEEALTMIRILLRTARDITANSARLNMQDEWEIYTGWRKLWLAAETGRERRQKRIRAFLQLTAEYWRRSQPSSSRRQWGKMAEVMWPSVLAPMEYELLDRLV